MKINNIYILAIFVLLGFTSCQDVIDLELPEGETQLVVEGWLNNNQEEQVIKITETQPYFDNVASPKVTGATVSVTHEDGTTYNFIDQGNGNYIYDATAAPIAEVGENLTLSILVNGKELTAFSEMHRVPVIDSIIQEDRDTGFENGIFCNFFSRDLEGVGDSYWIKTYQNNDYLSDPLNLNSVRDQLLNSLNTIFAEPVTNSPSNIVNLTDDDKILGIFTAGAISTLEITIE